MYTLYCSTYVCIIVCYSPELSGEHGKEQIKSGEGATDESAAENNEVGSKRNTSGTKRRRSEDELELHPTIDWEEEREGGPEKEGNERTASRKLSRRSGESRPSRRSGGEGKAVRTSMGEREGDSGREKRKKILVSDEMEKSDKEDRRELHQSTVTQTRGIKVCVSTVYVCHALVRHYTIMHCATCTYMYIHVHDMCIYVRMC